MREKNIALICGNFMFPDRNAAGKYNLSYGMILRDLGFNVNFIGVDERLSYETPILTTMTEWNQLTSYSMPYPKKSLDWLKYKGQFNRFLSVVERLNIEDIKIVIVFGNPSISIWAKMVFNWARANNIKIFGHCAENVRFSTKNLIYSIIRGLDDYYFKKVLLLKMDGVIVGGPLLFDFFNKKKIHTIIFPTMTDTKINKNIIQETINYKYKDLKNIDKKRFIYVGIPFDQNGKSKVKSFKDRIDKTIELFEKVSKHSDNFIFDVYGITLNEYLEKVPMHRTLLENNNLIQFHGKVAHDFAVKEIINSDFYIFHRDRTRITQAAFPTKGSESISLGVPLLTNDTSCIFSFVKDGSTGYILNDQEEGLILKLIGFDNHQISKLRNNCLQENVFDYRTYIESFKSFIELKTSNHES